MKLGEFGKRMAHVDLSSGRVEIGPALAPAASTRAGASPAEEIAEQVAEQVADVTEVSEVEARRAPGPLADPCKAEAIVGAALLGVRQDRVGLRGFLEPLFGVPIPRIPVRVVLHGQNAVRLLDLLG